MAECTHCGGTGRCQNDFHSGNTFIGGEDRSGQDHPGVLDMVFGSCPACGGSNTEWRPECTHCDGTGQVGKEWTPFGLNKRMYLGGEESVKERKFREREEALSQERGEDGNSSGGIWEIITEKAAAVGGGVGGIIGLIAAIESADSVGGYLAYIVIGVVAGAFLSSAFMTLLPWVAGLALLTVLLKACMG